MEIDKWIYRLSFIVGIILFIFGLFDLEETKFGYKSLLMDTGLIFVGYGYLLMKIYILEIK